MNRKIIERKILEQKLMDPQAVQTMAFRDEIHKEILQYERETPLADGTGGAIAAGDPEEPSLQKICMTMNDSTAVVEDLKKNGCLALTGAPGYGRVFAAQELAYALIGKEDPQRVVIAQFDQNYTFVDFLGLMPPEENFLHKGGLFFKLCLQAADHPAESYVFVINETAPGKTDEIFRQFAAFAAEDSAAPALKALIGSADLKVPSNLYVLALLAVTGEQKIPEGFTGHPMQASMHLDELQKQQDVPRLTELCSVLNIVAGINSTVNGEEGLGDKYRIEQNYMCPCALSGGDDVLAFEVEQDLLPLIKEYCSSCIRKFAGSKE